MRKKYLSALLFGALLFASAGTFTSCKDYDDDINNLQEQINTIASSLEDLKAQIGTKGVTSVKVEGGQLIVVTDGQSVTYDLPSGVDVEEIEIKDGHLYVGGVDKGAIGGTGSVVTVNEDGVLMIDGKEAGLKVGTEVIIKDASNGVYTISINGETIQLPMASAGLVSISPLENDLNQRMSIYYGLLTKDVEWDGAKAVDGKMAAGMYPVLEKDINVMLNPTGVDGTAYSYEFRDSENETPWGLKLGEASVYAGSKLTVGDLSRTTVSPSGVWTISRYLDYVPTKDLDERADYVTQFKQNDGNYYAFALQANDKNSDAEGIKSQYLYSFSPMNVNGIDFKENDWENSSTYQNKNVYRYGVKHTPDFDGWARKAPTGSAFKEFIYLSNVIYDYKLSIDESKMTKVKIDEYGLEITADKHEFIANNAQAVNNKIYLVIDYILINGQKGQLKAEYTIVNSDITIDDEKTVDLGSSVFNAKWIETAPFLSEKLDGKFIDVKDVKFDPQTVFGSNYDQWIDAMYNSMYNPHSPMTDDEKAKFLNGQAEIVGGDPINNVTYNNGLVRNFIYFDYVDAEGKSCIYGVKSGEELTRLQAIAGLKVYFIAGTYMNGGINNDNPVKAPYYTVSGTQDYNNGFALPLDNAFRVKVSTIKQEQVIAKYNFTFELTMPECPVTRDYNKSIADDKSILWTKEAKDRNGNNVLDDVLKVYGEKASGVDGHIYGDLRDAFINAFENKAGAYTATKEAGYYNLHVTDVSQEKLLLGQFRDNWVTLEDIPAESLWSQWTTVQAQAADKSAGDMWEFAEMQADKVVYNHYGVYSQELPMFYVKFASKIEDTKKLEYNTVTGQTGNGKEETPLMAQTKYDNKGQLESYQVTLTDANFTLEDAFGYGYKLFDEVTYKDGKAASGKKRNAINNMWANDREGINDNATHYGLNPIGYVDGDASSLVTFTLQKETISSTIYNKGLTITIDKSVAAAKNNLVKVEINVTDVFGHEFTVPVYIQTVK